VEGKDNDSTLKRDGHGKPVPTDGGVEPAYGAKVCFALRGFRFQVGVEDDVDVVAHGVGDGALLFGALGGFGEACGVQAGDFAGDVEGHGGDSHVAIDLLEGAGGADGKPLGCFARLGERLREGHAVATGVRCGDHLFGAGFVLCGLGARGPGEGEFAEGSATGAYAALPF
jgi:hypothetical protein